MDTKYKAFRDKILFKFLDEEDQKGFTNTTEWNFVVKGHEFNAKSPRWGKVIRVGGTVPAHIQEGDYILIEPLMWTIGFTVDDDKTKYWATDYQKVIGSLKTPPTGIF